VKLQHKLMLIVQNLNSFVFEGCWLQQKKGVHGQVCYKVFAIHMASQHGVVEAVMVEDGNDAALELVQRFPSASPMLPLFLAAIIFKIAELKV
jgi:hypothetical protein